MALISLRRIHLSFGDPPLLDGVDLAIEPGERVCLLGRNGEGKSTLMKVIAGEIEPDDGERVLTQGVRLARLTQDVPAAITGKVFDVVADGLGGLAELVKDYHAAGRAVVEHPTEHALERLSKAQHALEDADGWQLERRAEAVISRMALDSDAAFPALSGGMKRRVLLARALAAAPDLLMLDEPTNHLDIDAIKWLEDFLLSWNGTLVFVTHDRGLLRRLATRIVELDRGGITSFPGDYDNYLRRRTEMDNAEAQAQARFDKKLAQEEIWIRQGIKARRTRNEGRVRQLNQLREESTARRTRQGAARIEVNAAERSGKIVCEAQHVDYGWGGKLLIRDFSTTILRGDRIGIIGPNGCGKSTLLKLLLGQIEPDSGKIETGTHLEVVFFDQLRAQLDPAKNVLDNVAGGSDKVEINGRTKHVISYLQDFLFSPQRCRQPVSALSGGECSRLLLAKLFTRPANLLVLDEPTNDLDIETLELLEELLLDFDGTLLLVSHDRAFLDNVVTSTLVFEDGDRVNAYVGGYEDWLRQRPQASQTSVESAVPKAPRQPPRTAAQQAKVKKLTYKDKRELEQLPQLIEGLEAEMSQLQQTLADPDLYKESPQRVAEVNHRVSEIESELERAFERWAALEG